MKQLGVALHSYHDVHRMFPLGMSWGLFPPGGSSGDLLNNLTFATATVMMAGYYEQGNFASRYAWRSATWYQDEFSTVPFDALKNVDGPFRCPSDTSNLKYAHFWNYPSKLTNYIYSHGVNDSPCVHEELIPANERGAFAVNLSVRIRDVTDGTSSTIAMGEAANGAAGKNPKWKTCRGRFCTTPVAVGALYAFSPHVSGDPVPILQGINESYVLDESWTVLDSGWGMGWILGCTMEPLNKNPVTDCFKTFLGGPTDNAYTCKSTWAVNGMPPQPAAGQTPLDTQASISNYRSDHPSGGMFLLCDGSVQFVNENIDMLVYSGMSTIGGAETIAIDQ